MADSGHLYEVLLRCSYPGLAFSARTLFTIDGGWEHQMRVSGCLQDNTDPTAPSVVHHGRWWRLSQHMTAGEVAQTALMAVLAFEEHETRERFKVDGEAVFQPHWDLDTMVRMAADKSNTKERLHAPS